MIGVPLLSLLVGSPTYKPNSSGLIRATHSATTVYSECPN